jgi:hypothetical protein
MIPDAWYFDEKMSECPPEHEIMLVCDKYYALSPSLFNKMF